MTARAVLSGLVAALAVIAFATLLTGATRTYSRRAPSSWPGLPSWRVPFVHAAIERVDARRADRALPDVIEAVARSLRGGATLPAAIAEAAPGEPALLAEEWRRLAAAVADAGVVTAAERWRSTRRSPAIDLVASAFATAAEAGGPQARAIDSVALTLRQRLAVAAELNALTTQSRASALVLALAPIGFAVVASGLQPNYLGFLFGTRLGIGCLVAGVGLLAGGFAWMARITKVVP